MCIVMQNVVEAVSASDILTRGENGVLDCG